MSETIQGNHKQPSTQDQNHYALADRYSLTKHD